MSTTDTRAAFEAWAIKENYAFYSESERCVLFYGVSGTRNAIQKAWEAGMAQAATEAAKHSQEESNGKDSGCRMTGGICACRSGGSFGGCARERAYCCTNEPPRPPKIVEAAKATGTAGEYSHQGNRYGNLTDAEYIEMVRQETARQPAPVVARMVDIDEVKQLCRDYSSRTGSVYIGDVEATLDALAVRVQPAQLSPVKTWQERMDKDPALLELGALHQENAELRAVLSCLLHQTEGDICEMRKMKAAIADLRAALAATNRSQP